MRQKVNKPVDMITVPGRIYPDKNIQEKIVSFMRRFQAAKRTLLKRLSPKEGWKPFRLWGKLFGFYRAARKRAIREDRVFQGWGPTEWLSFMFSRTG